MFRVFICYHRGNLRLAKPIVKILEEHGLYPQWDKTFESGHPFDESIREAIAHAHVFVPIITPESSRRGWVHQEIGYAKALNIPILPIAKGKLPGQMIRDLQPVPYRVNLKEVRERLSPRALAGLVEKQSDSSLATYRCAAYGDDRHVMMAEFAVNAWTKTKDALVRQKGALSSFHIPAESLSNEVWRLRYGGVVRGDDHRNKLSAERRILGRLADRYGCRLLIDPHYRYDRYGLRARIVRLECLVRSLESMKDMKCQVAFSHGMPQGENLTIVGDWFSAESVSVEIGQGYRQTIFTTHAPSMLKKIEMFDQEMTEKIEALGWTPENSRRKAIEAIERIIANLGEEQTSVVRRRPRAVRGERHASKTVWARREGRDRR